MGQHGNSADGCTQSTAIVTGGLGALGTLVAGWLARQGSRRLVLLGRRAHAGTKAVRSLMGLPHSPAYGTLVTLHMADASAAVCSCCAANLHRHLL